MDIDFCEKICQKLHHLSDNERIINDITKSLSVIIFYQKVI